MNYDLRYLIACNYLLATFLLIPIGFGLWIMSFFRIRPLLGPEVCDYTFWTAKRRFFLSSVAFLAGAFWILYHTINNGGGDHFNQFINRGEMVGVGWRDPFFNTLLFQAGHGLLPIFVAVFVVKLYEKWVNGRITENEKQLGAVGMKAWFNKSNVFLAIGVATFAWAGSHGASFWGMLVITLGCVAAYPGTRTLMSMERATEPSQTADLSPERERVLRLLEQGRITADEGAELLGALAATVPPPIIHEPWTTSRKLMLGGALIVFVGFFLPWFSINIGEEVQKMTQALQQQIPTGFEYGNGGDPRPGVALPPGFNTTVRINGAPIGGNTGSVIIPGGDVRNGLGWVILILAAGAAALPYVATGMERNTRRMCVRIAVPAAAIVAIYLFTSGFQNVSYGLPIVLAGIGTQLFGLFLEIARPMAHIPQPRPIQLPSAVAE